MAKLQVKIKRVYEEPSKEDGLRFLVDRLWPRGKNKESLKIEAWLKDIAPSPELRKRFCHDAADWDEFKANYSKELDEKTELVETLQSAAKKGTVTLLYAAKEPTYNNAAALRDYLTK